MKSNSYLARAILFTAMLCLLFNSGFSQTTSTVVFKTAKSLPFGLDAMAYATDQKRIYIKGGGTSFNQYSNGFYAYDLKREEWLDFSKGINLKPTRFGKGVYLPDFNTIAFIGGIAPVNNSVRIIPAIIGYNLDTYRFSSLGNSPLLSKLLGAAYWKGKVYMFGGSLSTKYDSFIGLKQTFTSEVYTYSPENGDIESLPNHPEAKEMRGEVINGLLYTFGGFDDYPNKNIHAYNIKERVWSQIGKFDNPISAYALVKYNQYFLLIGDYNKTRQMIVFDTKSNTWEVYNMNFGGSHMGAVIVKNTLHVFGGKEGAGPLSQHWVLDLETFFK